MGKQLVFDGIHFKIFHEDHHFKDGTTQTFEYAWRRDGTRVLAVRSDHTILLCRELRYELNDYDWKLPGENSRMNTKIRPLPPLVNCVKRQVIYLMEWNR